MFRIGWGWRVEENKIWDGFKYSNRWFLESRAHFFSILTSSFKKMVTLITLSMKTKVIYWT